MYSTHKFERGYLEAAFKGKYNVKWIEDSLSMETAVLAGGFQVVSIFVNDDASAPVLKSLSKIGVKFLVLRSAGYNHVDVNEAKKLRIKVARVPEYSPCAVAEHAVALMLALNRNLILSHNRVMEHNFSLDGLVGFDMCGKTVGVIGTGKIGGVVSKIMSGLGCRIYAFDKFEDHELKNKYNVIYADFETLCKESDIITLHVPLSAETKYIVDKRCIVKMKKGVMLINTGRGALVCTEDIIDALKTGQIGYFGMDVYEKEEHLFFEDHSEDILQDETIARLTTFKNVLITGHHAFLTKEALHNIAATTAYNIYCFEKGIKTKNEL